MSFSGIEIITRNSLSVRQASRITEYIRQALDPEPADDHNWSWGYLRRQFKDRELEDLYLQYRQRLHNGYFSVFILLQIILSVSHSTVLLVTNTKSIDLILPDVLVYVVVMVLCWPMAIIVFKERMSRDYPWLPVLISCVVVVMLVVSDLGLSLYHIGYTRNEKIIRPGYATHTLLACYMFLPLSRNIQAAILGVTVTVCHMVLLGLVVYEDLDDMYPRLAGDAIYMICINGLGLYFRLMNEVTIRRTFLDRRACVESTFKLKYEKQQEDQLMLSILPRHIVDVVKTDIRNIVQHIQACNASPLRKKPFSDMYVKEHHNVSILYADVVNYSMLTVSLPVNKLVETLNELFGRFDEASEEHDVLRIKFLGDCYYCVAGVPESNPHHAKSCVDLGLDMINIIQEVREERKLKQGLDMRIGIHSGNILSGLLGVCKWQYDIWSKDVIIANVMEQSGEAGKVHATKQTIDLLQNAYKYYPGYGAQRSELLAKYNIETFFIVPLDNRHSEANILQTRTMYNRRVSFAPRKITTKGQLRRNTNENVTMGSRRRTVFMDNNLFIYQQTLKVADVHMARAIKHMHYGIHDRWMKRENINPLCLTFQDLKWELPYLKQPDPLFKFYVGCAFVVLLCMLAIQAINMPSDHWIVWTGFGVSLGVVLILMPFLWTMYVWNLLKNPHGDDHQDPKPENKFLLMLYNYSRKVVTSAGTRTVIFLLMFVILGACAMLEFVECKTDPDNKTGFADLEETLIYHCVPPWTLSHTCELAVLMSFMFMKIHFHLKLFVGFIFVGVYTFVIMILRPQLFLDGETWNPDLDPKLAHIMNIVFLTLTLHLLDRQAEYMMRLDYHWLRQLSQEQEDVTTTRMVNKMLLENILPIHVAKLYLDTNRAHDELYHEEYESVAVMFASLTEYTLYDDENPHDTNEKASLVLLNQIICDFDKLLFKDSARRIEKIKVAGWTYMAACGLKIGRRDSGTSVNTHTDTSENIIVVLAKFATKMMKVLRNYNKETFQTFNLRVGISHGPVTAGVVGSQKPLYDIWGDAVNMASRMDSTGQPGKIQVTPNTATILLQEGIQCEYRGETYVKGKGDVKTSFVCVDNNFKLVKIPKDELSAKASVTDSEFSNSVPSGDGEHSDVNEEYKHRNTSVNSSHLNQINEGREPESADEDNTYNTKM